MLVSVSLASDPAAPAPRSYSGQELEDARREAYQRGFEAAGAVIEAQLVEQREEIVHLQQKTLRGLSNHHESLTREIRAAVPELTMEIVRRVLGGMEPDGEAVARIVTEILQSISPGTQGVEVSLSEQDLRLMESYQAGFREQYPQIEFRADSQLQAGDCMVSSRFGSLDGRLATKLRSVDRLLQ